MSTMHSVIPKDMMRIESIASDLVDDVCNGQTSLDKLDVEAIGKKVMSQVSQKDWHPSQTTSTRSFRR